VALGSGSLPLTQNLALRTVVDALALEMAELRSLFLARTGSELPRLWDPSSPPAWLGRSGEAPGPDGTWDDGGPHPGPGYRAGEADGRGLSRLKALALLGLDEEASAEEIQRAYHRVTRVHHPDRYLAQGPEATLEAEETFRRIKAAYDFLTRVAP
jgi:DnaJ-domain-containing protein 1